MNDAYSLSRSFSTTDATPLTGILGFTVGRKHGGGIQLSGTFVGTVVFEESLDNGTTWISKRVYPAGGGVGATSATAAGHWKFATGGSTNFRVRCSSFTSGPINVNILLTEGTAPTSTPIVLPKSRVLVTSRIIVSGTVVKVFDSNSRSVDRQIRCVGVDIFIGDTGVAVLTGFLVRALEGPVRLSASVGEVYAITAGSTATVFVFDQTEE